MNKRRLLIILLTISFTSLTYVDVGHLQVLRTNSGNTQSKELCKFITSGLKFCTDKDAIVVYPNGSVVLNFSLTNLSSQEIYVGRYDGGNYAFKVTDNKDKSKLTKLDQKLKDDTMTNDDLKNYILSTSRNHRSVLLQPNQVYTEKIQLSDIYDFTSVGKHHVEITRTTRNPNNDDELIETKLGKIEIEVIAEADSNK